MGSKLVTRQRRRVEADVSTQDRTRDKTTRFALELIRNIILMEHDIFAAKDTP